MRGLGENSGAPASAEPLVIDVGATLVTAHSEKEQAAPTWKKTFGFHPILAYLDHGRVGTGQHLGGLLRPGNAGANTAADHIEVTRLALDQLPTDRSDEREVLLRTDAGGGTHAFLDWLTEQELSYSVGFPIGEELRYAILTVPAHAWTPAYNADGQVREGAWVGSPRSPACAPCRAGRTGCASSSAENAPIPARS